MRRTYAIALACLVAIAILSAMWIAGRGHEVADPNAFRSRPTVTPFPTLDHRPLRVDVEQRTIAPLSATEIGNSVSQVEPLADDAVLVANDKTGAWEIREQSGAHLVTLAVSWFASPLVSPGGRHLAAISDGAVVVYDWPERTSRTLGLDVAADAAVPWSPQEDRLAVLSPDGGGSSRLLVVQAADRIVLMEQAWVDGEDVYLEEWTAADALRVRVWEDGGCNPSAPNACLLAMSTLLEVGESGLTRVEAMSDDVSYYCDPTRCDQFRPDDAMGGGLVGSRPGSTAVLPDGRYVAILDSTPRDGPYLRLVNTSDQTFADFPVPHYDHPRRISWSPDSRFVYLSSP